MLGAGGQSSTSGCFCDDESSSVSCSEGNVVVEWSWEVKGASETVGSEPLPTRLNTTH